MIMTSSMTSSPAPIGRLGVMPNKTASLEEILKTGIDLIMNDDGLSFSEYTDLYTSIYNYYWSNIKIGRLVENRCMFHKRHLL